MSRWLECQSVEIDLGRPAKRRYDDVPGPLFAQGKRLLEAIMKEIPAGFRFLADLARLRTSGRFHEESVAIARRVNVSWRQVMLANISYDLALAVLGCSTIVLPTPDGPVLARNMDWWPEDILAQTSCLVRAMRNGQPAFANAGWPGAIGVVSGLSARGFGIVLNAVQAPDGSNKTGYPVLLHIRRVLEDAPSFDAAVHMLTEEKLATSCLLTVAGTQNEQRVVIERTPLKAAQRWADDDKPLIATNDYRLLFKPQPGSGGEIYETTCMRFEALSGFFASHTAKRAIDDAALLYVLSDEAVIQGITAQHVIIRPKTNYIRLWAPRHLLPAA